MARVVYTAEEAKHDAKHEDWGSLSWKASLDVGNAQDLTVGRVVIKKGKSNPRHRHPTTEEALYLTRGKLRHSVGDATYELEAGDTLVIAPGILHHAENLGSEDADMIVVYSKGKRDFELENPT